MLLGTLGANLLENLLTGKWIVRAGSRRPSYENKKGKEIVRAGSGNKKEEKWEFLMPSHPLANFEIQKYYENEPRFNGVLSRNNLPKKVMDGAYIINLDEYKDVGTHWIV